ncbi:MAG: hypothetical protein ACT4P1_01210 [Sporichthyaceae bacterium]
MSTVAIPRGRSEGARTRRTAVHRRQLRDSPTPWARGDRVVLAVCLAGGLIGLVIGWFGISDTVDLDSQARWLAFGILALIVGGLGMLNWLLSGLRNVTIARRGVLLETDRRHPAPTVAPSPGAEASGGVYGTVAGMRRFHTVDCLMLDGKAADFGDAATHAAAGLRPCGICLPDGVNHE